MLLQNDRSRPYTAKVVQDKIRNIGGIELQPHAAFSSDFGLSDYSLFRSMAKFFPGKKIESKGDVENGECGNPLRLSPGNVFGKVTERLLNAGQ
ncbi:hypothetical protein EVAR_7504_1 [Eumeta japonica]|uniref:Histone-lysine N-methyltransferase SETMAR n=1 Tax=Eumeta variegata TaxID=151549 RepID=A0A4C1Y6Q8_EUMVA|nr:hypothetical protein EVAR_7504_1 [Eumeta japonica]